VPHSIQRLAALVFEGVFIAFYSISTKRQEASFVVRNFVGDYPHLIAEAQRRREEQKNGFNFAFSAVRKSPVEPYLSHLWVITSNFALATAL